MKRALLLLLAMAAPAGCAVDAETSAVGKPCPCPSDLVCDDSAGVCVVSVADAPCVPRFEVADFHAAWATPGSIRWQWEPLGKEEDFSAYRLLVSENEAFADGDVIVFDSTRNAELGSFFSEDENGKYEVDFTISDGLASNHAYFARIEATDSLGCVFTSTASEASTRPPASQSSWFFQDAPSGYLAPCTLAPTDDCGTDGDACLQCTSEGACLTTGWENLYLRTTPDFTAMPSEAVTSGRAFLELSIAVQSPTPTYYSEVNLMTVKPRCSAEVLETCQDWLDSCCSEGPWFNMPRVHLRAGTDLTYQKLELPLDAFMRSETSITLEDLVSGNICGVRLGSEFRDATEVRLDDVAVRW